MNDDDLFGRERRSSLVPSRPEPSSGTVVEMSRFDWYLYMIVVVLLFVAIGLLAIRAAQVTPTCVMIEPTPTAEGAG